MHELLYVVEIAGSQPAMLRDAADAIGTTKMLVAQAETIALPTKQLICGEHAEARLVAPETEFQVLLRSQAQRVCLPAA